MGLLDGALKRECILSFKFKSIRRPYSVLRLCNDSEIVSIWQSVVSLTSH